jgi:hypothetical protein
LNGKDSLFMPACSTYLSDLAEQKVTDNRKKANGF